MGSPVLRYRLSSGFLTPRTGEAREPGGRRAAALVGRDSLGRENRAPCSGSSTASRTLTGSSLELDRLDPQLLRQLRFVLPNLADHRLGCLPLEEELNDLLDLGADDA